MHGQHDRAKYISVRLVKFLSTFEADPVAPFLDSKDAAQLFVVASEHKLGNPAQWIHQSCTR